MGARGSDARMMSFLVLNVVPCRALGAGVVMWRTKLCTRKQASMLHVGAMVCVSCCVWLIRAVLLFQSTHGVDARGVRVHTKVECGVAR